MHHRRHLSACFCLRQALREAKDKPHIWSCHVDITLLLLCYNAVPCFSVGHAPIPCFSFSWPAYSANPANAAKMQGVLEITYWLYQLWCPRLRGELASCARISSISPSRTSRKDPRSSIHEFRKLVNLNQVPRTLKGTLCAWAKETFRLCGAAMC